ncbi:MAG: hypothetical protein ACOCUH_03700 [Bacteriovoracia bacterium]
MYTHYMNTDHWSRQDEIGWEKALPIVRKILKKYENVIQRELDDNRKPLCTKKKIFFNGIGEDGHETFVLFNQEKQNDFSPNKSFAFCKTARKPYDVVVCEVLLVLNAFCPHLAISSDGFSGCMEDPVLDGTWCEAIQNVGQYGIKYHQEVTNEREPYCDMEPVLDSVS